MASDHPEKTNVALLIVTSERKFYLKLLALSLRWRKIRGVDHVLVVDTSINSRPSGGHSLLGSRHESYEIMTLPGVSFARVLRAAWASLSNEGASHVLMFEEDFVLLRRLPIERLVELANEEKTLQVVLPRQRWFRPEYEYRDRREYLRARHSFHESANGDRLEGFFTSNPHCMRLERIVALLSDVAPSDDYTWERDYAEAAAKRGLVSLQLTPAHPWVWHIGAATSAGVRAALESGKPTWTVYLRAHAGRAIEVTRRLAQRRWKASQGANSS